MLEKSFWLVARVVIFLANAFGLPMLINERTNFSIFGGFVSGIIAMVILFIWMRIHSDGSERLGALNAPFWPMRQYPLTYWGTIGASLSLAAFLNLLLNVGDHRAIEFFGGVLLLGLGMIFAVMLVNRFPAKKR